MSGPESAASPERAASERPRLYIASLSDYNAGILHGVWLDATAEPDDIHAGIQHMLAASPITARYGDLAEEWAIHDYENFTRHVRLGEWESIEHVATLARGILEHGEPFAAWWSNESRSDTDGDDLASQFEEDFQGEFATVEEYAEQLIDEWGVDLTDLPGIPESLHPYVSFDTAAWARDLVYEGGIYAIEGGTGVYVFNAR